MSSSSPSVDRYRRAQRATDHLPCALRFATGNDDVDLRWFVDLDHLVGASLEARGVRLDAGYRLRAQQLNRVIVPVLPRREQRIVRAPLDQLLLGVEAKIDKAARH